MANQSRGTTGQTTSSGSERPRGRTVADPHRYDADRSRRAVRRRSPRGEGPAPNGAARGAGFRARLAKGPAHEADQAPPPTARTVRLRMISQIRYGAPTAAVSSPTGSSVGEKRRRASRSARTTMKAPSSAEETRGIGARGSDGGRSGGPGGRRSPPVRAAPVAIGARPPPLRGRVGRRAWAGSGVGEVRLARVCGRDVRWLCRGVDSRIRCRPGWAQWPIWPPRPLLH